MARRIVCRCRSRPSSPIHAMSAAYSRSSLRSKQPPPTARHVGPHGPEPSAPHGSGPQERICSSSCLSWLHLLKSWSLRQSRGGSLRHADRIEQCPSLGQSGNLLLFQSISHFDPTETSGMTSLRSVVVYFLLPIGSQGARL